MRGRRSNCRALRQFLRKRSHANLRTGGHRARVRFTAWSLQNRSALRVDRHRDVGRAGGRSPILRSFWMTGFDGAGHLAGVPTTRDAIDTAAYRQRVDADYAAAREAGIACVLEAIDWRRAERADAYDFETLRI